MVARPGRVQQHAFTSFTNLASMIQPQSIVTIADNTGAKVGRVFKVLGGSKKRYARIGDVVVLSVQVAEPRKLVKKKEVLYAVVVRTKQPTRRKDGSYIRFDENAVVIIDKAKKEPRANRVFGPIPREIAELGYQRIASLAPEVL
jgi:large subunit ribosomal protein L14